MTDPRDTQPIPRQMTCHECGFVKGTNMDCRSCHWDNALSEFHSCPSCDTHRANRDEQA